MKLFFITFLSPLLTQKRNKIDCVYNVHSKIKKLILSCLFILILLLLGFMMLAFATNSAYASDLQEETRYDYFTKDGEHLPYYIQFNGGLSYPQKPNGDFKGSFNNAHVYEFEIGYKLGEDFRLGFNFGYRNNLKTKYSTSSIIE